MNIDNLETPHMASRSKMVGWSATMEDTDEEQHGNLGEQGEERESAREKGSHEYADENGSRHWLN